LTLNFAGNTLRVHIVREFSQSLNPRAQYLVLPATTDNCRDNDSNLTGQSSCNSFPFAFAGDSASSS
jgi:hypothetical protein